jgi:hypothetical protein
MKQKEAQQRPRIITITECPTEPCEIFYTDTLSQSILIECKNLKHKTNADIQKVEKEEGKVTRPANPNPQPSVPEPPSATRGGLHYK